MLIETMLTETMLIETMLIEMILIETMHRSVALRSHSKPLHLDQTASFLHRKFFLYSRQKQIVTKLTLCQ